MGKTNDWLDFDQLAEEKVRDALKPPSMYKVILVNDDARCSLPGEGHLRSLYRRGCRNQSGDGEQVREGE